MSVTGTGAGSLSISGDGTAFAYPIATGDGLLSISGSATAYAYAAAVGDGTLSISGSGAATAHPAGVGAGALSITGTATAAGYAAGTGDGRLAISGAASGGPVVSGVGAGTLSITGDGGDNPRAVGSGSLSLSGSGSAWVGSSAAGVWLYIHTTPPAQVYQRDELRGRLAQGLPMHRVPFSVSATQASIGQRNDAFSVSLDRPSYNLRARIAAQAPYGVRVDVMDGGTLSRTGIVSSVSAGAGGSIDLDCQGAGWADDLPMRSSADMGEFRNPEPLPWRFGRNAPGRLVRLNAVGTRWLWADHASSAIRSLTADGQPYDAWTWRNDVDGTGAPFTLVQTSDAFDQGAELIATGDGALDPTAGTLMTNPADVVYAICTRAGVSIDRGSMVAFRRECQSRALEVAGSITGGTLQAACAGIADSIYAAFSRELAGLMRLRPRTSAQFEIPTADTPAATAQRDAIATRIRARYALEDGAPRASVEMRAPAVEALRGVVVAEVTLPWITDARTAADVAGRILEDRARPRYVTSAARQRRRYAPGDTATVAVASLGLEGVAMVTAASIDERGSMPTLELPVGAAPAVEITAQSVAYTPESYTGATVSTQGTDRVLRITDATGLPIADALCVLDGSIGRRTDRSGRVSYTLSQMPAGSHVIDITAQGFQPFRLAVRV